MKLRDFLCLVFVAVMVSACAGAGTGISTNGATATSKFPQTFSQAEAETQSWQAFPIYNGQSTSNAATVVSPESAYALASFDDQGKLNPSSSSTTNGGLDPVRLSAMSISPSSGAFGPLLALDLLGNLPVPNAYIVNPSTFSTVPFLSFYKIVPSREASGLPRLAVFAFLKEAATLVASAHQGVVDPNLDLNWHGTVLSSNLTDKTTYSAQANVVGFENIGGALVISWSAYLPGILFRNEADDIEIGAVGLPQVGSMSVPDAGIMVYANTGRPITGTFLTPSSFPKLMGGAQVPDDWFVVFNTPVGGQVKVAVMHAGQVRYFDPPSKS